MAILRDGDKVWGPERSIVVCHDTFANARFAKQNDRRTNDIARILYSPREPVQEPFKMGLVGVADVLKQMLLQQSPIARCWRMRKATPEVPRPAVVPGWQRRVEIQSVIMCRQRVLEPEFGF